MVKIALDAMGGDNAPLSVIEGCLDALSKTDDVEVMLIGQEEVIKKHLSGKKYDEARLKIVPASEVIETGDHPVEAIREKKDSSMVVGMKMVRKGEADAFISAGNSGAMLVGGQVLVGRIKGVERAPFAPLVPTDNGRPTLLLDAGANVDARPSHLCQFAKMGSLYMEHVVGIKNPKVAILNVGLEEEKGNALVKETFPLLKEMKEINFIGSVEAREVMHGYADVCVAEGFTGNMVLKTLEGTASSVLKLIKKAMFSNTRSKIGALLLKPALKDVMKTFDASEYGGAPMLGLRGLVVKVHGNAGRSEFSGAIRQCRSFHAAGVNQILEAELQNGK